MNRRWMVRTARYAAVAGLIMACGSSPACGVDETTGERWRGSVYDWAGAYLEPSMDGNRLVALVELPTGEPVVRAYRLRTP